MRIYQITDTHVAPSTHHTRRSFERLMQYCMQAPPDLLVISGDLTQEDGDADTCRWMCDRIPQGQLHVVVLGNHDDPRVIHECFGAVLNPDPSGCFVLPLDEIDLIFINTGAGALPAEQLLWLQTPRHRAGSVVFTHYPTRLVSDGYMDRRWALTNREQVDQVLCESRIEHVFCGHFHAAYDGRTDPDAYELHITPSPAFAVDL